MEFFTSFAEAPDSHRGVISEEGSAPKHVKPHQLMLVELHNKKNLDIGRCGRVRAGVHEAAYGARYLLDPHLFPFTPPSRLSF